ncbi:MAG: glutamyl-tRNA reductase [Verrucomicrobia bacterium]|jgi:glutamyl-tRNA reductase|nr:glutamyl-tRNA reductase [Verrucomicrobiota bacterium]
MPIVVVGLSHHSSPVEVRERFAIDPQRVPTLLQELRAGGQADEAVILSTCNRVELYAVTSSNAQESCHDLKQFLHDAQQCRDAFHEHFYHHVEPDSLRHLFRVACGMESMVLGETEILGQLKQAYELAREQHHTGGRLNKAFQRAFNVAKQIRTETNIQRGNISVASVSVQLAERIFESLADQQVLVMGAGDTSEKTLRALVSRGVTRVQVTNRTLEKAQTLAAEFKGAALPFEVWPAALTDTDIVISSTSAPGYIITPDNLEPVMKRRRSRPLLLIDIAVPRDIDPEVNRMNDVYLYNVDDLQTIAGDHLRQRKAELERCEAIIREKAAGLFEGQRPGASPAGQQQPVMGT